MPSFLRPSDWTLAPYRNFFKNTHMTLKASLSLAVCFLVAGIGYAQQPVANKVDTWGNVPPARDDRFTNPKSKLYAGPNGWYNFGEVRADVSNSAKTTYAYKGSFQLINHAFDAVEPNKLRVLYMDFGSDQPGPGVYQVSSKANPVQKKVHLSFADVSNEKLWEWVSTDNGGTVTVTMVNAFLYIKCRNIKLEPAGLHNTGDLKQPMILGFEGAVAPE